jgi:GDP-fucose transporter C1
MPPRSTLVAVGLVCAGFFYGITPSAASPTNERTNTKLGIIYGVLSAGMIAVHAILVKWSMRNVAVKDMDASYVTNIAYLTNLLSALGLFPILILTGEVARWPALFANEDGTLGTFLIGSLITGTFGFFICMAALLSITVTSPVTHMFSAVSRAAPRCLLCSYQC